MFTMACFIQSSALLTAFLASVTGQDSWLVTIISGILCLGLIWFYRTLMVMFPDKDLLEVLEEVYGKVLGKIIGVSYVWFFFTLAALNTNDLGDFVALTLMSKTPHVVLTVMCLAVSAWAVKDGVSVVTHYSGFFMLVAIVVLITSILLTVNQIDLGNFLPLLDMPFLSYVHGVHIIATIPFGELVVFLMITPAVSLAECDPGKRLLGGFVIGGLTVLFVLLRDIAVLGNTLPMFTLPALVTHRLVNIGTVFSRMEILFAVILIMLLFFKITFLYYVSVLSLARLANLTSYRRLILAAGALIVAYGLTLYHSPIEHSAWARETTPFLWTFFEMLVPLVTVLIAKIRKLPSMSGMKGA